MPVTTPIPREKLTELGFTETRPFVWLKRISTSRVLIHDYSEVFRKSFALEGSEKTSFRESDDYKEVAKEEEKLLQEELFGKNETPTRSA